MRRLFLFALVALLSGCQFPSVSTVTQLDELDLVGVSRAEFDQQLRTTGNYRPVAAPTNATNWSYRDWVLKDADCFQRVFNPVLLVADEVLVCVKRGAIVETWMNEIRAFRGETTIAYYPSRPIGDVGENL